MTRVALVTGAAGAIGAATVEAFREAGYAVVGADRRPGSDVQGDLAEAAAARAAVTSPSIAMDAWTPSWPPGMSGRSLGDGPVADCTEEAWDAVLAANLRSMYLVSRFAVPRLIAAGGGAFVAVGSVLGLVGGGDDFATHAYAASKAGLVGLVRAIAVTYAREGVRANVVAPGLIATPMSARAQADEGVRARLPELQPLTGDFGRRRTSRRPRSTSLRRSSPRVRSFPWTAGGRRSDATTGPRPRRHGRQARRARERRGRRDRHNAATRSEQGAEAVLARLVELGSGAGPVDSVGVALPGQVDRDGNALFLPNLHGDWTGTPIAAPLAEGFGLPVTLLNDGHAFALAETRIGAARGANDVVCIVCGTGVGGGLVLDGRLHLGTDERGGEIGHTTVAPDGDVCGCGNRGCVEAIAGSRAIARAAGKERFADVLTAARAGESASLALERAGRALGIAVANLAVVLTPERVVVGGGVAEAGELLLAPLRDEVALRAGAVTPVDRVKIVRAELGPFAGAIGAALHSADRAPVASSRPKEDRVERPQAGDARHRADRTLLHRHAARPARARPRPRRVLAHGGSRGRVRGRSCGIPVSTTDLEEAISHPEVDCVLVGLPNHLHEETIAQCAHRQAGAVHEAAGAQRR